MKYQKQRGLVPIIGGKCDGQSSPVKLPRLNMEGEVYMMIEWRDGKESHMIYQLAGMIPAEVVKTYKERYC